MREVVDRMAQAMFAIWILIHESSRRSWEEGVRPLHLVPARLVTPVGWSLGEESRAVRLAGGEVLG